jgi:hypothetical protein
MNIYHPVSQTLDIPTRKKMKASNMRIMGRRITLAFILSVRYPRPSDPITYPIWPNWNILAEF